MKQYTINPFWDKRVIDSNKQSRIMLTIRLNGKQFRLSLGIKSTKQDFERATSSRFDAVKDLRNAINKEIERAELILERLNDKATKDMFLRLYRTEGAYTSNEKTDVYMIMKREIDLCKKVDRFGSAMNIYNAMNSFKSFRDKLYFEEIDSQFLKDYKTYMIKNGRSVSTAAHFNASKQTHTKQKWVPI
jgi:integrase/recombinase XerD